VSLNIVLLLKTAQLSRAAVSFNYHSTAATSLARTVSKTFTSNDGVNFNSVLGLIQGH